MANPLPFKPEPVDPREELARRVGAAPVEHAEALLSAWGLLEAAHRQGVLDLLRGLMVGRDEIAMQAGKAAATPEVVAALRNSIGLARLLASIDPAMLDQVTRALSEGPMREEITRRRPSLWRIVRTALSNDGRRGMAFAAGFLVGLGRALRKD